MDGKTLIDEVMLFYEGLQTADLTDSFYADMRASIKQCGQRIIDDLWPLYNWQWKPLTATVSISAGIGNGIGVLPADFLTFGHGGKVSIVGQVRPPLTWRSPHDILRYRLGTRMETFPYYYSVLSQSTTGVKSVGVYPFVGTALDLSITYEPSSPTLLDAVSPSGLERIPVQWHRTVVFEGAVMHRMRQEGDVRSLSEQQALYKNGLRRMVEAEIAGKGEVLRNPPYPGARSWYGGRGW